MQADGDIKIKMHRELRLAILRIKNLKENISWESTLFHHMEEDS